MAGVSSLRDYFLLEARHTPRRAPVLMTLAGASAIALCHLIFPRLPQKALAFMERGFLLRDMPAVLLFNDITAVYFAAFFVGLTGMLEVVVTPREEHRLELLLAKPVRPGAFLAARTWPVLATTLAVGVVVSAASAIAIGMEAASGASVSMMGGFGSGLSLTGLVLVQLSALGVGLVRMRDGFHALLVACGVWLLPMIPTATFLYRPDAFEGHEGLTSSIVLATLIWNDATLAWLGPVLLLAAIPICALLVRAGGALLERTDPT
jgi:hypothetical protein